LAKRLVRCERIRDGEDVRFGTGAMGFGYFVVLRVQVQIPGSGVDSPGRHRNLKFLQNPKRLLDIFLGSVPILCRDGDA
jgi:hypothetical protein